MLLHVSGPELRKALADIEAAEANGFMFCEAVFEPQALKGQAISLSYSDLWEKAHPTDPSLDWGRCQWVTKRCVFADGSLRYFRSL